VVVCGSMLRYRFSYWAPLNTSTPCSNNTINFAPFGRQTRASRSAGYYGALIVSIYESGYLEL